MKNRFENPTGGEPTNGDESAGEQITQPTGSVKLEAPRAEFLEKAQQDPRVHYVPSSEKRDFSAAGGPIVDASQYYNAWRSGKMESHKAGTYTFSEFVVKNLHATLQRDLAEQFPVSIRGIALNIGDTINEGQPNEVLGVSAVLTLGTERRGRTDTKIPTLRYDAGDIFPQRSEQWLQQSPGELRKQLDPKYRNQIFPAVLVYTADKPDLIGIYITDYMDEQKK